MYRTALAIAVTALTAPALAAQFSYSHEWTYGHTPASGSQAQGAEIVAFDSTQNRLWVAGTRGAAGGIDVLDLSGARVHTFSTAALGGINSVALAGGKAAISLTAPVKTDNGLVQILDSSNYSVLANRTVGANPDAVTFTPDGSRILVANEGEPSSYLVGPSGDPEGSVSIIDSSTFQVQTADFSAFNGLAATLRANGVRLSGPNASVAQDLEPEYIAVSADGLTAVATLQENNALAYIDIASATVTGIVPLGTKDHSLPGNGFDASDRDGVGNAARNFNIQNWLVHGLPMPDGITGFVANGQQYYVMAGEGDSRNDWPGGTDEFRVNDPALKIDPALDAALKAAHGNNWRTDNDLLQRLNITNTGDLDLDDDRDQDQLQSFGSRSFLVVDDQGVVVFDSGDQLEQIIATRFPALWDDGRSDNKGPEPESVAFGNVGGVDLLFVGLERANAIGVFEVVSPTDFRFLDMILTAGDVGPEGLAFFRNGQGGFLAVANEVSATTTLYRISAAVPAPVSMVAAGVLALLTLRRQRAARR